MYLILAIKIHEDGNSIESKKTRYLDDYRRRCSSGMKFFLMVGEINLFYSSQKRKMKNENRNYTQDSSYRHGCHHCDFISEQQLCWSSLITFRTRHQNHNKSGFKYFHFTAKKTKQNKTFSRNNGDGSTWAWHYSSSIMWHCSLFVQEVTLNLSYILYSTWFV